MELSKTFKFEKEARNFYFAYIIKYYEKTKKWEYTKDQTDDEEIIKIETQFIKTDPQKQKKDECNNHEGKKEEYVTLKQKSLKSLDSTNENYSNSSKSDKSSNNYYFSNDYLKLEELKILTYNVWFDSYNWDNRCKAIFEICEEKSPDVICFQEVTNDFLNLLLSLKFIKDNYYITFPPNQLKNWYDVIILTKFKCNAYVVPFISRMGRKLIYICIQNNTTEIIKIGTVHLESMNNSMIRENQLISSFNILDSKEIENICFKNTHNFLLGDFNFSEKENKFIYENNYTDVGLEILNKEINKSKNMDDKNNYWKKWCTMKEMKGYPAWRPDRITYKTTSKTFTVKHFEIVGHLPIKILDKKNPVDTPSDHYGIYMECIL